MSHRNNSKSLSLFLIRNPSRCLSQLDSPYVELLDLINGTNRNRRIRSQRQTVGIRHRIQRAHMLNLSQIHIRKHQPLSRRVNNRGSIRARKNIGR